MQIIFGFTRFYHRLILLSAIPVLIAMGCTKSGGNTGGGNNPTPTPPTPNPPPSPVWDPNAMRGVWVTTTASTALDSRENIKNMVTSCKAAGMNHIFVVVYNNARTIYPSTIMQNLIGKAQLEKFVGRDPLKECIDEAKLQGMKVHAWFEYGFASSFSANGGPIVAAKPD
ncbi:MAG: family 10 glycosylhydrolase, partial [Chitinophagaceae bacterium]|nr:family 10 glycosylhydrolase [Chitinophagaceae bacterium]